METGRGTRERRVVSVLFCDLVGFTDFSDGADPEDIDVLLESYFSMARSAIEEFGGTVEKFIGDAVVGVFGHPVAHDDDAERAVRAAMAIVEAVAKAEHDGGPWLAVRAGVNTGEALVRRGVDPASGEGFMAGDMINVAARIQHEAEPLTVLVGPETYAATRVVFDYAERGSAALRGKADPVRLFEPLQALARLGVDLTRQHDGPFVGRLAELGRLHDALRRVVERREPALLLVEGEPGIGKSRLVGQFLKSAQEERPELTWRQGRCLPYGEQAGIWALGEIVKTHLGVADTDHADVVRNKLDEVLKPGPDRAWLQQRMLPLLGVAASKPDSAEEQMAAWSRFLRDTFGSGPSVLVFEDIHWADPTLLAFLPRLVADAGGLPLTVIVTTRPEHQLDPRLAAEQGRLPSPAAQLAPTSHVRIQLPPLDDSASRTLLASMLAGSSVAENIAAAVTGRAEGNPLFLGELVRLLRDRGLLSVDADGHWQLAGDADLPVPDSLRGVIAARFDLLPETTRRTLATASVLGRTFWPDAVTAVDPEARTSVTVDLALAVDRDLVRGVPSSMTGHDEFAFYHALTRDVVYATLPRDVRAKDHAAAAAWLEAQVGERADEIADVLAYHLTTAVDLHTELGQASQAEQLKPAAAHHVYRSALQFRGADLDRGMELFEFALDLAGTDHLDTVPILEDYCLQLAMQNRLGEAFTRSMEAVEVAKQRQDAQQLVLIERVMLSLARQFPSAVTFDVEEYRRDWVERVLSLPASFVTIDALAYRARRAIVEGRIEDALADADRAVDVARSFEGTGSHQEYLGYALLRRGTTRLDAGDVDGLDDLRSAVTVARSAGVTSVALIAYVNLGAMGEYHLGPEAVLAVNEEGLRIGEDRGFSHFALILQSGRVALLADVGRLREAGELARRSLRENRSSEDRLHLLEAAAAASRVSLLTGMDTELQALLLDVYSTYELRQLPTHAFEVCALTVATALDDRGTIRLLLDQLWSDDGLKDDLDLPSILLEVVRGCIAVGDPERAGGLVDAVSPKWPMLEHALVHARALIDEHFGRLDVAAHAYVDAAARWRDFTLVIEEADARLGAARCFAAVGDVERARSFAHEARDLYAPMPAPPKIAECDRLLAALP